MRLSIAVVGTFLLHLTGGNDTLEHDIPKASSDQHRSIGLDKFNEILLTAAIDEFGFRRLSSEDSQTRWEEAIAHQWHLAESSERQAQGEGESGVPFLVCGTDYSSRAQDTSDDVKRQLGVDGNLMAIYNKVDMTCFITKTRASRAHNLTEQFVAMPLTPEMKMAPDTVESIEHSNHMASRIEIMLCDTYDEKALEGVGSDIIASLQDDDSRRLQTEAFLESRITRDASRQAFWQRRLRGKKSEDCNSLFSSLQVEASPRTIMFSVPVSLRSDIFRDCMHVAAVNLASRSDVCFVGVYQQVALTNNLAAGITQSGEKQSTPFFTAGLDGRGQIVALSDTGVDVDNCYMWDKSQSVVRDTSGRTNANARKVVQYFALGDAADVSRGHGTHVAGTIAGRKAIDGDKETSGSADGIARAAKLAVFDFGDQDGNLLAVPLINMLEPGFDAGARVHSASWGTPGRSDYTTSAAAVDQFMWEHPNFLFVSSAGNGGGGNKASSVLSPSTNKNGISVGASQNSSPHINARMSGPDFLADFSSRGPTTDGRRKPDITAPGSFLLSASAQPGSVGECDDTEGVTFRSGTSMSAPVISGTAALLRQYFQEGWHVRGVKNATAGFNPQASLIKAALLNGGQPLVGVQVRETGAVSRTEMYDFSQGYGRPSLIDSVPLSGQNKLRAIVVNSQRIADGENNAYNLQININDGCSAPLQATLAWTDPPGGAFCNKGCVLNDLDLYLTRNGDGGRFYPNGLSTEDSTNNVERVRIDRPSGAYTVHVAGTRLLNDQDYSLIVTGCFDTVASKVDTMMTGSPTKSPIQAVDTDVSCSDTGGAITVESSQTEDCLWLKRNLGSYGYLCQFWDVATVCPSTCEACGLKAESKQSSSISLPIEGNRRWFGIQFDIKAKKDIFFESVDLQINNEGSFTAEVYVRQGRTNVSREPWQLLCRTRVTGKGRNVLVPLDCGASHQVLANDFENIYITLVEDSRLVMQASQDFTTTTIVADSSDVSVYAGVAATYNDRAFFPGYAFSGSLRFSTQQCQDETGSVAIDQTAGLRTCDWLARNKDRYGFSCLFTGPSQHCPATCQVCS